MSIIGGCTVFLIRIFFKKKSNLKVENVISTMFFDCKELDYFAVVAPFYTLYGQDTTKEGDF